MISVVTESSRKFPMRTISNLRMVGVQAVNRRSERRQMKIFAGKVLTLYRCNRGTPVVSGLPAFSGAARFSRPPLSAGRAKPACKLERLSRIDRSLQRNHRDGGEHHPSWHNRCNSIVPAENLRLPCRIRLYSERNSLPDGAVEPAILYRPIVPRQPIISALPSHYSSAVHSALDGTVPLQLLKPRPI